MTRANLLTESSPGRYTCHDLLRAYAAELCASVDTDRDAARHRLMDHYVHTAYAAAWHLRGDFEPVALTAPRPGVPVSDFAGLDDATAWFTTERPALLAALEFAAGQGLDRHVCHLARAMFVFLRRQGRWHDRAETQWAAVAAAERLGDPTEESRAHRNLAFALADLGRFDDAHHHLDLALERAHDDPAGQAWTHYHRDIVYALQDRSPAALDAARRAHDLFEQLGDHAGQAIALTDLGLHHGRLGHHREALDLCEQALVLHQELGNRPHEAHAWSCLADTHLQLRDPARAIPCYHQALELFRELGDPYAAASTLAHLGGGHHLAGDHAAAREVWLQAHAILDGHDPSTMDQIRMQLAIIDEAVAEALRAAVSSGGSTLRLATTLEVGA